MSLNYATMRYSIFDLRHRVQNCSEFVAVDAIYHRSCLKNLIKQTDEKYSSVMGDERPCNNRRNNEIGRPENPLMVEAFHQTCEWLECYGEPKSMFEIEEYMSTLVEENVMWTRKYLKKKLQEKYGDNICFSSDRYRDIIILKDMACRIINDRWYEERHKNIEEDKKRIIHTAAKLIQAEIRERSYSPWDRDFSSIFLRHG